MKKQSSISFIEEKLEKFIPIANQIEILAILTKAKQMHEEEIIEANMSARLENSNSILTKNAICKLSQQYYNQNFNK